MKQMTKDHDFQKWFQGTALMEVSKTKFFLDIASKVAISNVKLDEFIWRNIFKYKSLFGTSLT